GVADNDLGVTAEALVENQLVEGGQHLGALPVHAGDGDISTLGKRGARAECDEAEGETCGGKQISHVCSPGCDIRQGGFSDGAFLDAAACLKRGFIALLATKVSFAGFGASVVLFAARDFPFPPQPTHRPKDKKWFADSPIAEKVPHILFGARDDGCARIKTEGQIPCMFSRM